MCEIVDNYAREAAKEAASETSREIAEKMCQNGVDFDVVC